MHSCPLVPRSCFHAQVLEPLAKDDETSALTKRVIGKYASVQKANAKKIGVIVDRPRAALTDEEMNDWRHLWVRPAPP
jgi:hypothetical protein